VARSYGAVKVSVWEVTSEFRQLSPAAQWGYMMLISQPQLNNLGVLPYAPEKWHRFAAGMTLDELRRILQELADNRYVVIDETTDELLVRTFIKHDKVWAQPKLITNARRVIREVESEVIRDTLVTRHPWLVDDSDKAEIERHETTPNLWKEAAETPSHTPSDTPIAGAAPDTPTDRGIETPIPTRAPAGPGPGAGGTTSVQEKTKGFRARDLDEPDLDDEPGPPASPTEQPSDHTHQQVHALVREVFP
jgi:hypothetical protein